MLLQPQVPGYVDARANRNLLYVVAIFSLLVPSAGTLYPNKLKAFIQIVYLFGRAIVLYKEHIGPKCKYQTIDGSDLILHFVER